MNSQVLLALGNAYSDATSFSIVLMAFVFLVISMGAMVRGKTVRSSYSRQ